MQIYSNFAFIQIIKNANMKEKKRTYLSECILKNPCLKNENNKKFDFFKSI